MRTIVVNIKHEERSILERRVEDYFRGYDPLGYGTRLDRPVYYDEDEKCWVAVVSRQSSCD